MRYHLYGFDLSLIRSRNNKLQLEWISIVPGLHLQQQQPRPHL